MVPAHPGQPCESTSPCRLTLLRRHHDWQIENRIKEQQLDLFADRTSTQLLRANQIRLYFSSFAYILLCALRRLGLKGTDLASAQCGTIRVRLLKLGAQVRVSVRRVWIAFSESFPAQGLFLTALRNIQASAPLPAAA
jgi:hypothetical protein